MTEIAPNIYWVGGVDWNLRNFHGYKTEEGSSYNAYLIVDEKITLIDTVKEYLFDEMIDRISEIIDPSKIDYIISEHTEMDHSGSIPKLLAIAKNAKLMASPNGVKGLKKHFHNITSIDECYEGMVLNTGKYNLRFYLQQMLHWPDNMAVYLEEEKILFSNDAFGQHIASGFRWDDEYPHGMLFHQVAKYYANIILPYNARVKDFVKRAIEPNEIKYICPAHGIMFRKYIPDLVNEYTKWMTNTLEKKKAVIIYDTMWKSTENMAYQLQRGLDEVGVRVELRHLSYCHISNIMTDIIDASLIVVGTPTLNNDYMPTVSGFLTYMKGLKPEGRVGFAFGSYGWSGEGVKHLDEILRTLKGWVFPLDAKQVNYVPTESDLKDMYEQGKVLGKYLLNN